MSIQNCQMTMQKCRTDFIHNDEDNEGKIVSLRSITGSAARPGAVADEASLPCVSFYPVYVSFAVVSDIELSGLVLTEGGDGQACVVELFLHPFLS